jgi:hypothetical protein
MGIRGAILHSLAKYQLSGAQPPEFFRGPSQNRYEAGSALRLLIGGTAGTCSPQRADKSR